MKTYRVDASGDTFRVKHDLKEWGFTWISEQKLWRKNNCDEGQCNLFRHWARGAEWEGVDLDIDAEEDRPLEPRPSVFDAGI